MRQLAKTRRGFQDIEHASCGRQFSKIIKLKKFYLDLVCTWPCSPQPPASPSSREVPITCYCFHIPPLKSALPHQVAPQVGFAISSHAMSFIKAWFHPVSKYLLSASSDLGCTYTFLKYSQLLLCWLMEGVSFEPLPLVQPRQQIQEFISLFYILLFLLYRAVIEQFSCDQDCTKELTYVVNHNDYNRNFKMICVLTAWPLWMYLKRQCIREANCSELCS